MTDLAHVLILDDDPHLRATLGDILALKGFAPIQAKTGKEALDYTRQSSIDVA